VGYFPAGDPVPLPPLPCTCESSSFDIVLVPSALLSLRGILLPVTNSFSSPEAEAEAEADFGALGSVAQPARSAVPRAKMDTTLVVIFKVKLFRQISQIDYVF
jgi:hypothetical protein